MFPGIVVEVVLGVFAWVGGEGCERFPVFTVFTPPSPPRPHTPIPPVFIRFPLAVGPAIIIIIVPPTVVPGVVGAPGNGNLAGYVPNDVPGIMVGTPKEYSEVLAEEVCGGWRCDGEDGCGRRWEVCLCGSCGFWWDAGAE